VECELLTSECTQSDYTCPLLFEKIKYDYCCRTLCWLGRNQSSVISCDSYKDSNLKRIFYASHPTLYHDVSSQERIKLNGSVCEGRSLYSPHFTRKSLRGSVGSGAVWGGMCTGGWTKRLLLVKNSMTHQGVTLLHTD
jgi:hypothetical protein